MILPTYDECESLDYTEVDGEGYAIWRSHIAVRCGRRHTTHYEVYEGALLDDPVNTWEDPALSWSQVATTMIDDDRLAIIRTPEDWEQQAADWLEAGLNGRYIERDTAYLYRDGKTVSIVDADDLINLGQLLDNCDSAPYTSWCRETSRVNLDSAVWHWRRLGNTTFVRGELRSDKFCWASIYYMVTGYVDTKGFSCGISYGLDYDDIPWASPTDLLAGMHVYQISDGYIIVQRNPGACIFCGRGGTLPEALANMHSTRWHSFERYATDVATYELYGRFPRDDEDSSDDLVSVHPRLYDDGDGGYIYVSAAI